MSAGSPGHARGRPERCGALRAGTVTEMDRHRLQQSLARFLLDTGRVTETDLVPDAALITSGLINSVTLFSLALWIEEAIGRPVDLSQIALPAQWDTVEHIVAFIEREADPGHEC